jgi:hydrogenase nickel incorporation protein HypB
MKVTVLKDILSVNDQMAVKNRQLLENHGITGINIMASPGAGKTSLILKTIESLKGKAAIGVIEGDIASTIDADRIGQEGVCVVQINTGGGCHLDANMVSNALDSLPLDEIDFLFIENVGNLVCPAAYRLGEHIRVVLTSTPEGDDKPQKYPVMFTEAEAIIINKIDLLSLLDFDPTKFKQTVTGLNPNAHLFELSSKTGQGFMEWTDWLMAEIKSRRK